MLTTNDSCTCKLLIQIYASHIVRVVLLSKLIKGTSFLIASSIVRPNTCKVEMNNKSIEIFMWIKFLRKSHGHIPVITNGSLCYPNSLTFPLNERTWFMTNSLNLWIGFLEVFYNSIDHFLYWEVMGSSSNFDPLFIELTINNLPSSYYEVILIPKASHITIHFIVLTFLLLSIFSLISLSRCIGERCYEYTFPHQRVSFLCVEWPFFLG